MKKKKNKLYIFHSSQHHACVRIEAMKKMCPIGVYLLEKCLWKKHIYLIPQLHDSSHFPHHDKHSYKHSKDPRNCPVVLFFDSTHFVLISFLLGDPVIVMPVSYNYMSLDDLSKMFKVEKKINKIYRTFCTVVHNFLYNMIFNITKHQDDQEKKLKQPEREPTVKVTRPRGRRTRGIPNEFKQLQEEKRKKQIREQNIKIDFRTDKMSECLLSVIITLFSVHNL